MHTANAYFLRSDNRSMKRLLTLAMIFVCAAASQPRADASASFDAWSNAQPCQTHLYSVHQGSLNAPSHADWLSFQPAHDTDTAAPRTHAGEATNAPVVAYDAQQQLLGVTMNYGEGGVQYSLCKTASAAPADIARAPLGGIRTQRGIAIGMMVHQVIAIDGVAKLHDLGGGWTELGYLWPDPKDPSQHNILYFLFSNGRLAGISSLVNEWAYHSPPPASTSGDDAPCDVYNLAPSMLGTSGAAGSTYAKVALINTSNGGCVMPAYPALKLTAGNATFSHAGGSAKAIDVPPGGSAILQFAWSNVDERRSCSATGDLEIAFTNVHPLWVPVNARACDLRQLPVHAGPTHLSLPGAAAAGVHYEHWFETLPCEGQMLWLSTHSQPSKTTRPDTFRVNLAGGTTFDAQAYVGMAIAKPVTALYDNALGAIVASTPFQHNAMICGYVPNIPYGIARDDLFVKTARGVSIGAPLSLVERLEGAAKPVDLGNGYSALQYVATQNGVQHFLTVLFLHGTAYAIAYSES